MFCRYLPSEATQMPERSGRPSGAFGVGAERLGFPSAVLGVPGTGTLIHCADAGAADIAIRIAAVIARIITASRGQCNAGCLWPTDQTQGNWRMLAPAISAR